MEDSKMHFLKKLRNANIARTKEWSQGAAKPFALIFWANELGGEIGEACNVLKKLDREHTYKVRGSYDTVDHLAEEFGDIIICCDLLALHSGIDLSPWVEPSLKQETHDYSLYGASLLSIAGQICGVAVNFDSHINNNKLRELLNTLVFATKLYADRLGIDLVRSTTTKFNLTSYKLGLQTVIYQEE